MKYTVSLEVAKELKEQGWTKKCQFWWKSGGVLGGARKELVEMARVPSYGAANTAYSFCEAPMAEEIIEELPIHLFDTKLWIYQTGDPVYAVRWKDTLEDDWRDKQICNKNLSDALGLMWIYLKKQKLIN